MVSPIGVTSQRSNRVCITGGSPDSICSVVAQQRAIGKVFEKIIFTQPNQLSRIDISKLIEKSVVLNIAVDNSEGGVERTTDFLKKVLAERNKIVAIPDEHDAALWETVLQNCGVDKNGLIIKLTSKADAGSSCEVVDRHLSENNIEVDEFTREILEAGKEQDANQGKATRVGDLVNKATKVNMADNNIREHIVTVLTNATSADDVFDAENRPLDQLLNTRVKEYDKIQKNNSEILNKGVDLGDGIVMLNCEGLEHDAKELCFASFKNGYNVAVLT